MYGTRQPKQEGRRGGGFDGVFAVRSQCSAGCNRGRVLVIGNRTCTVCGGAGSIRNPYGVTSMPCYGAGCVQGIQYGTTWTETCRICNGAG